MGRGRTKIITQAQIDTMAAMRAEGKTLTAIADALSISTTCVMLYLNAAGVKKPGNGLSEEQKLEIRSAYRTKTAKYIAAHYNISTAQVSKICFGIPKGSGMAPSLTAEQAEEIRADYPTTSAAELAERHGVSIGTISNCVQGVAKAPGTKNKLGRPKGKPERRTGDTDPNWEPPDYLPPQPPVEVDTVAAAAMLDCDPSDVAAITRFFLFSPLSPGVWSEKHIRLIALQKYLARNTSDSTAYDAVRELASQVFEPRQTLRSF